MQRGCNVLFVRAQALAGTKNVSTTKVRLLRGLPSIARAENRSPLSRTGSKSHFTLKFVGAYALSQRRSYSTSEDPDNDKSKEQQNNSTNEEPITTNRKEFKFGTFTWRGNWSDLSLVGKTGVMLVVAFFGCVIVLFFALAIAQSLSIYSLYQVTRGDHWFKYLAFFPYLQWFPALELAEMPQEWGIAAVFVGLARESLKKSSNAMLKPPALRSAAAFLTVALYAMMYYRNEQIMRRMDGDTWTSIGLLFSFTAPIFWPLLAFQADSFGKAPAFLLEQKLATTAALLDPAERIHLENELVLARASAPNVFDFMQNGAHCLREAAAYKKDVSRNPALRWSAEAARWFGFQ